MWKVRFLGIDKNGYTFLKNIQNDLFSVETHNNSNFIEYFIHIVNHENEEATKVLEIAEKELRIYISFLRLNGYESSLTVDFPCKINEDGTRQCTLFFEDKINVTDTVEVSINGEEVYSSYQSNIEKNKELLVKALKNESKRELLILLGYEQNWINAYKIYEILKTNFQDEAKLKKYGELKYFAHSANSPKAIGIDSARHAVQSHQNPKIITDLEISYNKLIELSLEYIDN